MKPGATYIDGSTIHPRTGRKLSDSAETKKIDFLECPYAVVAYLKILGLKESNVKIVHMEQPAIVSAFLSGQGDVAQTCALFNYHLEEKGMKILSQRTLRR